MDMWITAKVPVTHIPTASVTEIGLVISLVFHLVLFVAGVAGRQLDLVGAKGDYSLASEGIGKK